MVLNPPTDDELREFLALDEARTQEEWRAQEVCDAESIEEDEPGFEVSGPKFLHAIGEAYVYLRREDAVYTAACTRIARAVVEELLERREAGLP